MYEVTTTDWDLRYFRSYKNINISSSWFVEYWSRLFLWDLFMFEMTQIWRVMDIPTQWMETKCQIWQKQRHFKDIPFVQIKCSWYA